MNWVQTHSTDIPAELAYDNHSATWSDDAFDGTDFLFAHYRDFAFPADPDETFAIGVIEAGQRFLPGRAPVRCDHGIRRSQSLLIFRRGGVTMTMCSE